MSDAPVAGVKPAGRSPDGATLGKYTKSSTPPSAEDVANKLRATRAERYELLAAARGLFLFKGKQERLEHPHDWHRTAKCKWISVAGAVGVHASCEHRSAFFSGLMNCGSVWACPVCAAKVQERRREEIAKAIAWAYKNGLQPVMVTLTFPHYAWQNLADLVGQQADALRRLRAGAPWSRFKTTVGYQGLIRSLELTLGQNGWHPHTHELWFVASSVDAEDMKLKVLERWKNCCARAGLLDLANAEQVAAFDAHAVDVKGWCDASDYLAKQDDSRHWGADRELAKGSTKAGRAKGKHPFGLLSAASVGDKQSGAKFIEYAAAMKGKRQLFWSSGLKTQVGLVDRTDEELAEEERDSAEMLGLLDLSDWKLVREAGKRAQLLDAAERGGWPAVQALLKGLAPILAPSAPLNKHPTRRRSAMQQVALNNDEKMLWIKAADVFPGEQLREKVHAIVRVAPRPRVDEELTYLVSQRDMPSNVWPALWILRSGGYAEGRKDLQQPDGGEVMEVDGSIFDLLMEGLKRLIEAVLGIGESAGTPPAGPGRKTRPARQGALLIEHDRGR